MQVVGFAPVKFFGVVLKACHDFGEAAAAAAAAHAPEALVAASPQVRGCR